MLDEAREGWPSAVTADLRGDGGARRRRDPRADERQPLPLRRLREHRPGDRGGGADEAVRLRTTRPTRPARSRCSRALRGRALPGRRHQPRRPDEARGRDAARCSSTCATSARAIEDDRGRRAADRRGRDQQRARRRPRRARALPAARPGRAGGRVGPAAQRRHRRRQPAPAHPLRVLPGRHEAVQQAAAGLGLPGARGRAPQPRRARALARRASPRTRRTWRSRWPRSARPCTSPGRAASARSRSPACTGCPATSRERDTVLEPGELIVAVELPPPPMAARSRLPQGPRPRLLRVRGRLRRGRRRARRTARCATAGSPSAGSRTCRGAPSAPRRRCAARPPARTPSAPPPTPSWPPPSRCATTPSRSRWPATCSSRPLAEVCA